MDLQVEKINEWIMQVNAELPSHTTRVHLLDGNFKLGMEQGRFPYDGIVGDNRNDHTCQSGLRYKFLLGIAQMKCDTTITPGGSFPTYFSASTKTRCDYISSDDDLVCKHYCSATLTWRVDSKRAVVREKTQGQCYGLTQSSKKGVVL